MCRVRSRCPVLFYCKKGNLNAKGKGGATKDMEKGGKWGEGDVCRGGEGEIGGGIRQ